jgi:hypothetical protein
MMDIEVIFNRFEAALWLLIAAWIALHALLRKIRNPIVRFYQPTAALTFAAFGVSDIIESYTGAWWTPWWLFTLKLCCVAVFVFCYFALRRAKPAN